MSASLLLDHSAWANLAEPTLPDARAEQVALAIEAGQLAVSVPFLLEVAACTSDASVLADLRSLEIKDVDATVADRARRAELELARAGHSVPAVDLLTAALADVHGLGILHYDGDYDRIAAHTDLRFKSVWLAPCGSL